MQLTPRQRAIRTTLQIAAGLVALAVPLIAGLGLTAHQVAIAAPLIAFAGGVVALVQNVLEANGVLPVLISGAPMPPASPVPEPPEPTRPDPSMAERSTPRHR